jgi:anti-sigma B factor antagonist
LFEPFYRSSPVSPETMFSIERSGQNGAACLHLCGEVDAYTAPILRRAIANELHQGKRVVLDCTRLDFIDGSGLKVIEWAVRAYAPETVEVRNAAPVVRQLAAITGLDRRASFATDERSESARGTRARAS